MGARRHQGMHVHSVDESNTSDMSWKATKPVDQILFFEFAIKMSIQQV